MKDLGQHIGRIGQHDLGLDSGDGGAMKLPLTPKEREQAQRIAGRVIKEATKRLGDTGEATVTVHQSRNIMLWGKRRIESPGANFGNLSDADLIASYYEFHEDGDVTHAKQHLFAFFPGGHVDYHIRYSATRWVWERTRSVFGREVSRSLPYPIMPLRRDSVAEANPQELRELLGAIKKSRPFILPGR
ncbi:MAG: hypothetical protein HY344_03495 [Candidatus Levybacteria bacterium]|nr:hypothetical protein [Candidatus Levybacteria bacterium]